MLHSGSRVEGIRPTLASGGPFREALPATGFSKTTYASSICLQSPELFVKAPRIAPKPVVENKLRVSSRFLAKYHRQPLVGESYAASADLSTDCCGNAVLNSSLLCLDPTRHRARELMSG